MLNIAAIRFRTNQCSECAIGATMEQLRPRLATCIALAFLKLTTDCDDASTLRGSKQTAVKMS